MDERDLLLRMLRNEFGNIQGVPQVKIVTVDSVDYDALTAEVEFAQGATEDEIPDTQTVKWLRSYVPVIGNLAYLLISEGAPVLIGSVETNSWQTFTLPSGYTTSGLPYRVPGYLKDRGRVLLRGVCNIGASNAAGVKFTLPSGYRPAQETWIAAPYSNGTSITGHLRYEVDTDGTMETMTATPAATVILSFEGLSFDVR